MLCQVAPKHAALQHVPGLFSARVRVHIDEAGQDPSSVEDDLRSGRGVEPDSIAVDQQRPLLPFGKDHTPHHEHRRLLHLLRLALSLGANVPYTLHPSRTPAWRKRRWRTLTPLPTVRPRSRALGAADETSKEPDSPRPASCTELGRPQSRCCSQVATSPARRRTTWVSSSP